MPVVKARASTKLVEFSQAQIEFVGKAVVLTDGKVGTVDHNFGWMNFTASASRSEVTRAVTCLDAMKVIKWARAWRFVAVGPLME